MPSLSTQIETLYRVIGPSGPASRPRQWTLSDRWICWFYCLWFSLPLSIWLSNGSIGLLLYWQALLGVACLRERLTGRQGPAFAGAHGCGQERVGQSHE
jgi:hypothetical protein